MEIDYGTKEFMNFLLAIEGRLARGLDPFHASPGAKRVAAQPTAAAGRP
jgi:hypothetical protein